MEWLRVPLDYRGEFGLLFPCSADHEEAVGFEYRLGCRIGNRPARKPTAAMATNITPTSRKTASTAIDASPAGSRS